MTSPSDTIDIDDLPELLRLIADVRLRGEFRLLRWKGEIVAALVPPDIATSLDAKSDRSRLEPTSLPPLLRREKMEANRQAFRDSAGSWKGLIDAEKFLVDNAESRRIPGRPFPRREKTEADYASFRSAAGSWKGTIDADQFTKENYESRRIDTRPPVDG